MNECILVRQEIINETLATAPTPGKHVVAGLGKSIDQGLAFKILEDVALTENEAEVHRHEGDLWHCLEGEAEFVYGGKLVNGKQRVRPDGTPSPDEWFASEITGGTTATLHPGDWLWIPAGQPHQHLASTVARLIIIKISHVM